MKRQILLITLKGEKKHLSEQDFLGLKAKGNYLKVADQKDFEVFKEISLREKSKLSKPSKSVRSLKEIYLSPLIDRHDLENKLDRVEKLSMAGKEVKILVTARKLRKLKKIPKEEVKKAGEEVKNQLKIRFQERLISQKEGVFLLKKH